MKKFFKKIKHVPYNSGTTILKCNTCHQEQIEWYNDQPGDPCKIYTETCSGIMIRVTKTPK